MDNVPLKKDTCFDNADQLRFSKAVCTNVDQQKTLQKPLLYLKHWIHLDRLREDSDTAELDMWEIPHKYIKKAAQENDVVRFACLAQSSYLHALKAHMVYHHVAATWMLSIIASYFLLSSVSNTICKKSYFSAIVQKRYIPIQILQNCCTFSFTI